MALTTPDSIFSPDAVNLFDYNVDMAALASSVQTALTGSVRPKKVASVAERTAYLTSFGTPTVLNPCTVYRTDAPTGLELEINRGLGWGVWLGHKAPVRTIFTASGTYTPTAGLLYANIEVVGGGGGGAGAAISASGTGTIGAGGGGGGYSSGIFLPATIGASQVVTVDSPSAGAGGGAGTNNGSAGGSVSVGALISATGGGGGTAAAPATATNTNPGVGGTATGGTISIPGGSGHRGLFAAATGMTNVGVGGSSFYGQGGDVGASAASAAGFPGTGYGAGGAGAHNLGTSGTVARAGGAGSTGVVIVTEYF